MASRAPRHLLAPSLRASARSSKANVHSTLQASRRAMSSTAEAAKKSSDMPWIIGSAVVFGPAFLYLVSPASRKSAPHVSHGKHEKEHELEPMPMKDDEGTEADVSGSVKQAEAEDAPKVDSADKEDDKPKESAQTSEEESQKEPEPTPKDPAGSKDEPGPTEQGQVRKAASQSGGDSESPKGVDEKINKDKAKEESS